MSHPIPNFDIVSFDCYGTLIDWETGIWDALQPLFMHNRCTQVSRANSLTLFGELEQKCQSESPFRTYLDILERIHSDIAQEMGLETRPILNRQFAISILTWPAFPDTADSLRYLGSLYKIVILSNVDRSILDIARRRFGVQIDASFVSEEIGSYKPNIANFEIMLANIEDSFDVGKARVLHVAQSLYHDHVPAKTLGINSVWIDRQNAMESGQLGAVARSDSLAIPEYRFPTLADFVDRLRIENAGA